MQSARIVSVPHMGLAFLNHIRSEILSVDEWRDLCQDWPNLNLMQCAAYGDAKSGDGAWTAERLAFSGNDGPIAICQVLVRDIPIPWVRGGIAWINRGPVFRRSPSVSDDDITAVLQDLRRRYVDERGYYLRIAPGLLPDSIDMTDACPAGYSPTGIAGWHTAVVDLSRDLKTIRASLKQKWRNVLNRAERQEFLVDSGDDRATIEAFTVDHEAFVERAAFETTVTSELIRALSDSLEKDRGLVALSARTANGDTLGWVLMVVYGETAEYLAGNSTPDGRKLGIGQLLLWRAMTMMHERGLESFDVGGMDPVLTPPGIYKFKEGLGGVPRAFPEEIDAVPSGPISGLIGRAIQDRVQRAVMRR